jgi:hypothetical protein
MPARTRVRVIATITGCPIRHIRRGYGPLNLNLNILGLGFWLGSCVLGPFGEGGACRGRPGRSVRRPARRTPRRTLVRRPLRGGVLEETRAARLPSRQLARPLQAGRGRRLPRQTPASCDPRLLGPLVFLRLRSTAGGGGSVCSARDRTAPSGPRGRLRGVGLRRVIGCGFPLRRPGWWSPLRWNGMPMEDLAVPANHGPRGPRLAYAFALAM